MAKELNEKKGDTVRIIRNDITGKYIVTFTNSKGEVVTSVLHNWYP